jgi:hypothetical protein
MVLKTLIDLLVLLLIISNKYSIMKKVILVCISIALGLSLSQHAHAQVYEKGDVIINAGIGLGTTFSFGPGGLGIPFGGGAEFAITDVIGVGGEFGFLSGSGITVFYIGPKGYYHFNELLNIENEALDVYGGLALFYRNFSFSGFGGFGLGSGIVPGFHVGGRYYFSEKFGVMAELGNSYGWLKLGVCLKF